MDTKDDSSRGLELLYQTQGKEHTNELLAMLREISPDFADYIVKFVIGDIWTRNQLDMKTKSLVTIAFLVNQPDSLAFEVAIRSALSNGATKKEIYETILHMVLYQSLPICWEALVIAEMILYDI